jgi:hypothetical protein
MIEDILLFFKLIHHVVRVGTLQKIRGGHDILGVVAKATGLPTEGSDSRSSGKQSEDELEASGSYHSLQCRNLGDL